MSKDLPAPFMTREAVHAGTRSNRAKAWTILATDADPLDILGGPKVRAFYANIMTLTL